MASIIRPTTPLSHVMPEATPSKKVSSNARHRSTRPHLPSKAAAALQAISLESPIKPVQKLDSVIDDARRSPSPDSESEKGECEELGLRKRFVGDVDLPESASFASRVIH
jgi:ribonucleoside-diphosphate reductase subunit M2